MFLQDSVISDCELPRLLVVTNDEGGVPLRGPLHPVHAQPLPHQHRGGGQEDPLGRHVVAPFPNLTLGPRAHGKTWSAWVPFRDCFKM